MSVEDAGSVRIDWLLDGSLEVCESDFRYEGIARAGEGSLEGSGGGREVGGIGNPRHHNSGTPLPSVYLPAWATLPPSEPLDLVPVAGECPEEAVSGNAAMRGSALAPDNDRYRESSRTAPGPVPAVDVSTAFGCSGAHTRTGS